MGNLTREFNWSGTSVGSPGGWPQSLRTTVGILLNSSFPMFLFWGEDLICFYNDAYRPSLGNDGKHPGALGQQGAEVWPEIWPSIKPLIDQVRQGGGATWREDQFLPIYRNGRLEDVYWTYSYSPVIDEDGNVGGVLVVCTETTEKVETLRKLHTSQDHFQNLVREATVGIIVLHGEDMQVTVANDAFGRLIGRSSAELLGKPLFDIVPETAADFRPLLEKVRTTGEAIYLYDSPYQVLADGQLIKGFLNLVYQPFKEQDGTITGVMALCQDVTQQVMDKIKLEESEHRFRSLIESSPVRTVLITGKEMILELANEPVLRSWGKDRSALGKPLRDVIAADQYEEFHSLLEGVYTTGIAYHGIDKQVRWVSDNAVHFVDFTYQPIRNAAGEIYGILSTAIEVTEKVLARKAIRESEQNLLNIILQAPVAMCILHGPDFVVQIANDRMYELWGRGKSELFGKPLFTVLPEASGQGFEDLLKGVYTTGQTYTAYGVAVNLPRNGKIETVYINLLYEAFRQADGSISGIMAVATDVTQQVLAGKKVEESEQSLRSLVESAPFPIGVYTGKEMRIVLANQSILDVWGKGYDVIGKPYASILPELENQQIFDQLDSVFTSGTSFHAKNQRVDLVVDGKLQPYYFNYSFTPLYDAAGNIYGVMNTAADVTDLALASQQIIEAEASLRSAIELAELGTWTVDLKTRSVVFSDRLCLWTGLEPGLPLDIEQALGPIPDRFLGAIREAGVRATEPGSDGTFDVEYSVINQKTGKEHILHAQGKAFTKEGAVYRFAGTAQDITKQRKLQQELELLVQQRTAELQSVNAELAEANEQLQHSNEELAQYAYVASHDLQEPLRKIRIFSGLLHGQKDLTDHSRNLVGKMDAASERMVMLINDLLEFSRLLNSDTMVRPIDLNEVCQAVVSDFEVSIAEKGALVEIGKLPVISAVALQMNQLFYNLLSNALKFTKPDAKPSIKITATELPIATVARHINKPDSSFRYYDISVEDNGIGFDAEYADQIFEVFKRLHGRDIYPGSGVGLALCRRIAANHKGHLYAASTPGVGSTFHVILPDRTSVTTE